MTIYEAVEALREIIGEDNSVDLTYYDKELTMPSGTVYRPHIDLMVMDFDGFDESWEEIMLDYNGALVDRLSAWCDEHSAGRLGRWSGEEWDFLDFVVELSYASEDI